MKQILRSLYKDKLNTLVLVVSLAVGFAGFNLIILFLNRELSTDNFHTNKDRIYALKCDDPWFPGGKMYQCKAGSGEYMKNNFSQVEDYCYIINSGAQRIIVNDEDYYDHPPIIGASANFFDFFSYKLLTNNSKTALESGNNIVISTDIAKKYFGSEDPVGKTIEMINPGGDDRYFVSGVFEKPHSNTQINFEMVRLVGETDGHCYVRLSPGADKEETERLFAQNKESIPIINTGKPGSYYLMPLHDAYFDRGRGFSVEKSRDITDLYIALIIGLIIIAVALFNYLGIITNRFLGKLNEFRIRHINGGKKINLINRFMLENSILVMMSFLLSLYLMFEALPFFNSLTETEIPDSFMFNSVSLTILGLIVLVVILVTFLFVYYKVYHNKLTFSIYADKGKRTGSIRIPGFSIFQIASSFVLITCSIVIIMQMEYITNKPIGLDKDVIEIRIPGQYREKAGVFKEELMSSSLVRNVSCVNASPVLEHYLLSLQYQQDGTEKQYTLAGFSGDEDYLDVLGIKLLEGSNLTPTTANKCLINRSFTRFFPDRELLGRGIPGMEDKIIAGIVEDFHYSGLKSMVEPAFISFDNRGSFLLVKASGNNTNQLRELISEIWTELIPGYPVNIESIGDRFEWFHRDNQRFLKLIISCSLISIFLSMIGIFTISYQQARLRTKEIGIRKINGANLADLLLLINKDLLRWILIAFSLAVPVSWYAMHRWLENYAYRTTLSWWVFVLSAIIILVISILTVSFQSYRAATRNPVEALRYE
ncbi:MAG TPA: ABC transporter permease [Bacteroidales bacterium]|nr:ABC transporter permease [Bacteroidales bacterium]